MMKMIMVKMMVVITVMVISDDGGKGDTHSFTLTHSLTHTHTQFKNSNVFSEIDSNFTVQKSKEVGDPF